MAIAKRARSRGLKSASARPAKIRAAQSIVPTTHGFAVSDFYGTTGVVKISAASRLLGLSNAQLFETAGVSAGKMAGSTLAVSKISQGRLREMLEIISRISGWAGGALPALAWYRAQPLPAFGSRTAEALVKEGKAAAVRDYLDHIAVGGFA